MPRANPILLLVAAPLLSFGCLAALDDPEFASDGPEGRLFVTTTDFSTGSLSVFDVHTREMTRDVAVGGTDTIPFLHEGRAYLLHRFMIDRIDVRDPEDGWSLLGQHALETVDGDSANAQSVAFAGDGRAFVTQYGEAAIRIMDLDRPSGSADLGLVSLADFADADGRVEAGPCHAHGDEVFVFAERLDQAGQDWPQVDTDLVLVVDTTTDSVVDDFPSPGRWVRQLRPDPNDDNRLYALSTGIAVVDLEAHVIEWSIDEEAFAAAGIPHAEGGHKLPQSFDLAPDGRFYVAAYTEDFDEVRLFRATPGGTPEVVVAEGLLANERTLEIIGDELWFGDTSPGSSGLRGYDLGIDPPEALAAVAVSTGLAPYSIVAN